MSGISGFPSSQKLTLPAGTMNNFATIVPTDPFRNAIDILRFAFRVGSDAVPRTAGAATGKTTEDGLVNFWIEDAATPARRGDFVRFEDGAAQGIEFPILKVEAGRFLISCLPTVLSPISGDKFYIMRFITQRTAADGSQLVTVTPPQYNPITHAKLKTSDDNITDAAYTELIAATPNPIQEIEIFNKTGMPLILAFGAAAAEQDQIFIGSDGLERQSLPIPTGTRISLKSVDGTANDGLVLFNSFG